MTNFNWNWRNSYFAGIFLHVMLVNIAHGVKILFNSMLSYFFGKILFCPIFWEMSYFILFFGHFAFNFGILYSFYHHYFMQEHSLKIFSLASLAIKILFSYIMLESIFKTLSMAGCPVMYVNVGENELFS